MWCRSYRDHVIMAFPSFDTATNLWAPQASISWVMRGERKSAFVRFAKRVFTEAEAAACALGAGQSWVDGRLKSLADAGRLEDRAAVSHPPSADSRRVERARFRDSRRGGSTLTFDEFKSWICQSNPKIQEEVLKKSYAALAKLRKHQHCSWARIMTKMKKSQVHVAASRPPARSAVPLPLTLRDWRRII